jgi:aryl-alcohol dehydrogenase-like predicted oxidoreductase
MALKRMDNVGIVVDDLAGTIDFFRELGIGFVPFSPLGKGFLTGTTPRPSSTAAISGTPSPN